jgi:thiosulfate/3-mercaptopyruvate sulfurtransferase
MGTILLAMMSLAGVEMLVSTDWLAAHLKDDALVVMHVGSQKDYDAGHIPGARLLTLAEISVTGEGGLRLELPPVSTLKAALEKLGVSNSSRVVIYPAGEAVQAATRVWFTLDYLGLGDRASLLDGGLAAWRAEGRPVSTEAAQWTPGTLTVTPRPALVAEADWIHAHLKDPKVRVVDARTPEFYSGENAGGMPRAGHVPGAVNVPFSSLLGEGRKLLPAAELREKLGPAGGTTVTYCHIGAQATVVYFVARYLGHDVKLYDGSWQEWSGRKELPAEAK